MAEVTKTRRRNGQKLRECRRAWYLRNRERILGTHEAAIAAMTNGAQEYKIGWRSVRRADLPALLQYRRQLRVEVANPRPTFPCR